MSKQQVIDRILANVPAELRNLDQWVTWRYEPVPNRPDPTKVLYNPRSGFKADSTDPATWASFDNAATAYVRSGYDGIGFVVTESDPYTGVDIDGCIAADGSLSDDARRWVDALDSYTEVTPSGTGLRIYVRANKPGERCKNAKAGVEIYSDKRFFTVTGNHLADTPMAIEERPKALAELYHELFPAKPASTNGNHATIVPVADIPDDDQELLNRMFAAKNGSEAQALWDGNIAAYHDDESAADMALCAYLAFWTGKDAERMDRLFRQSGLMRDKWDRNARQGETYGQGTILRAIAGVSAAYDPSYRSAGHRNGHRNVHHNGHTNGHSRPHSTLTTDDVAQPFRMPPPPVEDAPQFNPLAYRAEDGGIMDAWLERYGSDWLFVVGPDTWHRWVGTHWGVDEDLSIRNQLINLLDEMNHLCAEIMREAPGRVKAIGEKYAKAGIEIPESAYKEIERIKTDAEVAKKLHAATKRSSARVASVETMSRAKRALAVDRINVGDALNLANGVLSLKSLELRLHERGDLFTYCLPYRYDPAADCPRWKQFVSEVLVKEGTTETDPELVLLFQELLGYSLTPYTKYEAMVWMFGEGSNGKSVAIGVVEKLLGSMAMAIDFQALGQPGNYDLADIPGKRVIFSTESERGKSMAEGYIKKIVTGDSIKARPIYGSPLEFHSTAKIWWSMNDKPIIKDTTDSMWRRMKLIPFYRKFEEGKGADPDLPAKLEAELSGILNWAIEGLIRLTVNGKFTKSMASEIAKQEYREEANPVAQWVNTMTVKTNYPVTLQAALFSRFIEWCKQQNERACTSTQFGKDLKRLKIDNVRKSAGQLYALAFVDDSLNGER